MRRLGVRWDLRVGEGARGRVGENLTEEELARVVAVIKGEMIGNVAAVNFLAEIGDMNYGLQMDATPGVDAFAATGAELRMRPLLLEFEE